MMLQPYPSRGISTPETVQILSTEINWIGMESLFSKADKDTGHRPIGPNSGQRKGHAIMHNVGRRGRGGRGVRSQFGWEGYLAILLFKVKNAHLLQ